MEHSSSPDRPRVPDNQPGNFEREVLPLTGDLRRRAYAYTRNAADADDLVQETLLKAYRAYDTLGGDPRLKAWLMCIMRNTWITAYRATLCRPAENLVDDFDDSHGATASAGRSPESNSAEHIVLREMPDPELVEALSALPESMRLTVYYVAVEGLSCREVARVMGVPKGTVMSRMHRGRSLLRHSMGGRRVCNSC